MLLRALFLTSNTVTGEWTRSRRRRRLAPGTQFPATFQKLRYKPPLPFLSLPSPPFRSGYIYSRSRMIPQCIIAPTETVPLMVLYVLMSIFWQWFLGEFSTNSRIHAIVNIAYTGVSETQLKLIRLDQIHVCAAFRVPEAPPRPLRLPPAGAVDGRSWHSNYEP